MFRQASELPSNSLVVRGGIKRTTDSLVEVVKDAAAQGYGNVISVFADVIGENESIEDALFRICESVDIPHKQIQVSNVQRLIDEKFSIEPYTFDMHEMHCHVVMGIPFTESIPKFVDCFDEPQQNPTGGKSRL